MSKEDSLLCLFIEHLWEEGEGRAKAADTLASLQDARPWLKRQLPAAWRLVKAWSQHELPARASPFTENLVESLVGAGLARGRPDFGLACLLAFRVLLRTGELNVSAGDFSMDTCGKSGVLNLGQTKTSQRLGASEGVVIDDPVLLKLVNAWLLDKEPGDKLLPRGMSEFRKMFSLCLKDLGLDDSAYKILFPQKSITKETLIRIWSSYLDFFVYKKSNQLVAFL